jgi:AcrR family transcriptional regulator
MSPYPAQTDLETIVTTAAALIEAEGAEPLSLHRLAAALGVKAPSLYRYVPNKAALLRAVNERTSAALVEAVRVAGEGARDDPAARILAMARAYRAFAQAHPAAYGLAFAPQDPAARPDPALLEQMVLPLQALVAAVSGEADSLTALRGLWALLHGYVLLELADQMQRGGDLAATFTRVVEAYVQGWAG